MRTFFSSKGIDSIPWPYTCTFFGKILIRWTQITNFSGFVLLLKDCVFLPGSIIKQSILLFKSKERIIHLNSAVLFSTAIAAKLTRKKIVWHIREASNFPRIVQFFIKTFADEIICISYIEASRLGGKNSKIHVVYNPVDFTRFNAELYSRNDERLKLGIPLDAKVIVSFGGVMPRKGAKEIVAALQYCDRDTYAIIAGPPLCNNQQDEYHKCVEQLCKKVGSHRIKFTGIVENPAPFLACADLLVFAGLTPHFPRPIFEAWAMKKPVIVFKMEGISNNVEHMTDGIVVDEISGKALGTVINNILGNRELLTALGSAGYSKANSIASQENSSKAVERILSLLNARL